MNTEMILYGSNKAAKFVTGIEGWVDSNGNFFGKNEHLARYSGCTHIECKECNKPIPARGYTICKECRMKKEIEKYNSRPRLKWDGEAPLYSDTCDEYFFDEDSLHDYIADYECTIESLQLIICVPNKFREIDDDYFSDELSGDDEIPAPLKEAMNELNRIINEQPPASWSPGKYAADLSITPEEPNI